MYEQKVAGVFDEPGCSTNRAKSDKERKTGCSAKSLTPGAAAGGCAFDGAKIALQPITRRHRPTVARLWQLYQHDLSEFRGSMPDNKGRFKTDRLRRYLGDSDRTGIALRSALAFGIWDFAPV